MNRKVGDLMMRYPGDDPENGPAYLHRWNGHDWECAEHRVIVITETDEKTGKELHRYRQCRHCGEYLS